VTDYYDTPGFGTGYSAGVASPSVASGAWLPSHLDSYVGQAGLEEGPQWDALWKLEQEYRNSPELYRDPSGSSFFTFLAQKAPEYLPLIRNASTEAYDQRIRNLAQQGVDRYQNLLAYEKDRAGIPYPALVGLSAIGGGLGSAFAGGGAAAGSSTASLSSQFAGMTPGLASGAGTAGGFATAGGNALAAGIGGGMPFSVAGVGKWLPYVLEGANALLGYRAAGKAADASEAGSMLAIAEGARQYDQSREDQMPWLTSGRNALAELDDPNAFQASPDYNFVRSEGIRDIGNSFAAQGGAMSGNAMRALTEYNTGLASGEYGNWFARRLNKAGMGADAATNIGALGANRAANAGNAYQNAGDARSSGILGRSAAIGNAMNGAYNTYRLRQLGFP
jgi:hypothetical protein